LVLPRLQKKTKRKTTREVKSNQMTRTTYSTSMNKEEINNDVTILFKIVDKLEQRISTLEKVLQSHAKCIGEMREDKNEC
jgi:hypothetical protein